MHISDYFTIFARQMHRKYYILYLLLLVCAFTACAPRSIREAQSIVAQADSLRAEGCVYSDSAELALAYEALGQWQWFYADEYAHACYHYGRILREKEHPVEAMQCFINATHSRTRDYHILGRVYSNMGDIAHLAGNYPLSFEMYKHSGEMYLKNKDTLLYYYDLNNMAFELMEQGKKDEVFALLTTIEELCSDQDVLIKAMETKVVLYEIAQQHDSVIFYSSLLLNRGYKSSTVLLNRAKAYSFIGQKDSAVYYANMVLSLTDELYDKNNALYILTNDDKDKSREALKETASLRADIQKIIEDQRSATAQASQLLEQDLQRKPNLTWLYSVLATLVIIGTIIGVYVYKKHRQHILLSQQVDELEIKNVKRTEEMLKLIEEHCSMLRTSPNLKEDLCWKNYDKMCAIIDTQFNMLSTKLKNMRDLNEKSFRMCVLTLLNVDRKTISEMLPYALNSVGKLKDDTAKSLGTTGKNLRTFLLKMTLEKI